MADADLSIDAYGALIQYDGYAWPASLSCFWETSDLKKAWGPERVGTCKNSREVICGLVYLADSDYAIKRFGRVSETSKKRGMEVLIRFRRDNSFEPKRKPAGEPAAAKKPAAQKPAHKPAKKPAEAIYDGAWAGVEEPKYEESASDPVMLPTDSMKIKKVDYEGETIWVAENGMAFLDWEGQPDELIGTYQDGELTFKD